MRSNVTGKLHLFAKQYKTADGWLELTPDADISTCWTFSKQGAKKMIERLKTKTYKINYDKGLIEFETMDEFSY